MKARPLGYAKIILKIVIVKRKFLIFITSKLMKLSSKLSFDVSIEIVIPETSGI